MHANTEIFVGDDAKISLKATFLKMEKYFSVFRISMMHSLKNYKLLIGLSLFAVTCLLIFAHIWQVSAAKMNITSLNPSLLLWYIAYNEWILIAVPDIELDMERELKDGQMAYLLPRPISYLGSKIAEATAALLVNMIFIGTVCFAFVWAWTNTLPLSSQDFIFSLILGFLGGFLSLVFTMVIGLLAFYFDEVEPVRWVWEKFLFVLGGLMLPLFVYPEWIGQIAKFTPFSPILGGRSGLIFHFEASAIMQFIFSAISWIIIGLGILYLIYRQGLKRINVDGG